MRWIVVLVLGTAIAAARLYYPDILDDASEFANGIWDQRVLLGFPIATEPVSTPTVPVSSNTESAFGAEPSQNRSNIPVEGAAPINSLEVEAAQPTRNTNGRGAETFTGQTEATSNQVGTFEVGTFMNGSPNQTYITLWSYPGDGDGHQVIHRYEASTAFEVVEPDRMTGNYPVEFNGNYWLRVQADDGLVGWVKFLELEVSEGQALQ